jgi:divalent metal cation (Fe/Co/Zn/Cd) transporter
MAGNLGVSRYKAQVARQIHSITMEAEANRSCLDTVSSFGALVGLIGVALGYRWADPIAGGRIRSPALRSLCSSCMSSGK